MILVKFILSCIRLIGYFINLYVSIVKGSSEKKCVPPPKDDLLKISATRLAEMIRKKKISSEDVVNAYITRIKEVNPIINAIVEERFEAALKEAKAVSDYLRTTSLNEEELKKIKPLLGVPVTIKESCMVSGMSLTGGAVSRRGIKAENDGDAVARIKIAGAIPLLVSNTSELCFGYNCYNNNTGKTCNPYDTSRNSGASSGGEGALLGSAASLIGIGSDLGGSIRFPSFCCGVFGHKPSPRTVPIKGHFPFPSDKRIYDYMSIGPLTRYAEDLNLVMTVLAGKQAIELKLHEKVDLKKLRVYYMTESPSSISKAQVQTEIKDCIDQSVKYLEKTSKSKIIHNCSFEEDFQDIQILAVANVMSMDFQGCPDLFKGRGNYNVEFLKSIFGLSEVTSQYALFRAIMIPRNLLYKEKMKELMNEMKRKIALELKDDAVLLYPTFHKIAPKHEAVVPETMTDVHLIPFNTLGFPATNIPCGLSPEGLPLGIQVIAGPNQDRLCLAVAEELEKCFGGWTPSKN